MEAPDCPQGRVLSVMRRFLPATAAVLDTFADSDFRLGGTDSNGYFIGGAYGLDRNAWVSLKWLSADELDGLPYAVDVLQLDLNAKF